MRPELGAIFCTIRRRTDTALHMQALASPPASAYLQGFPLKDDLPAPAPAPTPATPAPAPEAPPPILESGMEPSPQSPSPAPDPGDSGRGVPTYSSQLPPSRPRETSRRDDVLSTGQLVGGAVGIVAALVICVAAAIYVFARQRRIRRARTASAEPVRSWHWTGYVHA